MYFTSEEYKRLIESGALEIHRVPAPQMEPFSSIQSFYGEPSVVIKQVIESMERNNKQEVK